MTGESIRLQFVLEKAPAGVVFGIQKGHGSAYEIVQHKRATGRTLRFEISIDLRGTDFGGPYVQGRRGERFVYINVGTYAGDASSEWSRRIKVPLLGIHNPEPDSVWEARIPGTGRDGTPSCATVRPMDGWKRVMLSPCSTDADS